MSFNLRDLSDFPLLARIGAVGDKLGLEVHVVGGFVRDSLLGSAGKDIDFVVVGDGPAFAQAVADDLAAGSVVFYEKFGTALIEKDDYKLEFVGARKESYRGESRKPHVEPATLSEDLTRRDFTINAIAVGLNESNWGAVSDPFSGIRDLERRVIRTPLEPESTFSDDPLRIMRAIRFAARLGFEIDEPTRLGMNRMADRLQIVSMERISDELLKILQTRKPSVGFELMQSCGVLKVVFDELLDLKGVEQIEGHHHKDVFYHTLQVVDNVARVSDKLELRYTALVHDIAKPRTKQFVKGKGWTFHNHEEIGARMLRGIGRRLRFPGEMTRYAQKLTRLHLRPIALTEEDVTDSAYRRLLVQAGEQLHDLLTLCRADITSRNPKRVERHLKNFDFVVQRLQQVEDKDRMRAFQSPVRGDEIMQACGLKPGPHVGKLKKMIEDAILDGEIPNDHDAAYAYLQVIKKDVLAEES